MSSPPRIETNRLILRMATDADVSAAVDYVRRNRTFHRATSPTRSDEFFEPAYWRVRLADDVEEFLAGMAVRLFVLPRDDETRIIGAVQLSNIIRGPLQAAVLGYSLDEAEQGRGLMLEAVQAVVAYAFNDLGLHRLMAGYAPTNARSGSLLRKLGFVVEGYARDYLMIDGRWQDHVLTSLTNANWNPASGPAAPPPAASPSPSTTPP